MSSELQHVVISGGGTAGHLFPGLAVAEQLASLPGEWRFTFAGGRKELEQAHVSAAGFDYLALPCQPLPRRPRAVLRFMADNLAGYRAARTFLKQNRVAAVVGVGGYASIPMARAAASLKIPLVLLEQNAVPGRATRWLASAAEVICLAMPEARQHLSLVAPVRVTGNPLRRNFASLYETADTKRISTQRLLVLGGSGGAHALNEQLPKVLYKLRAEMQGWRVVHQTGQRDLELARELYRKLGVAAQVVAFVQDVPHLLSRTSLAVCRAGGTTLSELAVAGVPSVLLPYPHATDDHQRKNADVYAAAGASQIVDQRELNGRTEDTLVQTLRRLLPDRSAREQMSTAAQKLARPDAAWHVAMAIGEVMQAGAARRGAA